MNFHSVAKAENAAVGYRPGEEIRTRHPGITVAVALVFLNETVRAETRLA